MLIFSDKQTTTKCQPPALRAWVADRAAVARLGPDNTAAASGTSHHPPPSPRAGSAAPSDPPESETHANAVGGCRHLRPIPGSTSFPPANGSAAPEAYARQLDQAYCQGSVTSNQSDVLLNFALAGLAGQGGSNGSGIGGGLYVTSGGVVTLHKPTAALNFASTSNNDIYGTVSYD